MKSIREFEQRLAVLVGSMLVDHKQGAGTYTLKAVVELCADGNLNVGPMMVVVGETEEDRAKAQNKLYAERLSRVTQALTEAAEYINQIKPTVRSAQGVRYFAAMKVVNSGLADDQPPPCGKCMGTGLQARASRVKELEEELIEKQKPGKGWE
jgi:hypothetical protein